MKNNDDLQFDEFVKKVKPDAGSTDDPISILAGYIGESPVEGHVRLYYDERLNRFTDIPKSAIVFSQQFSKEESPLGGSKLWIKRSGMAASTAQTPAASQKNYLAGDLYETYSNQMYEPQHGSRSAVPAFRPTLLFSHCKIHPTVTDPWCPYPTEICTHTSACHHNEAQPAYHVKPTVADPWCPYPTEICTHTAICRHNEAQPAYHVKPTVVDPWCPYPTEICTHTKSCRRY
jgi:hypothetical protein